MRLCCHAFHGQLHSVQEKYLGVIFCAVTKRGGDKLFCLRNSERCKQIWKHRPYAIAKPNIKKIGKISVTDIVVIWWIS